MKELKNYWCSISAYVLLTAVALGLFSCNKEDDQLTSEEDEAESVVLDEAIVDDLFEEIDLISNEGAAEGENEEGGRFETNDRLLGECVGRGIDRRLAEGVFTKTVTLDFLEGCVGPKGRERQGTMIITQIANTNESTYTVSTSFENFYLDGKKIEGTRTRVYTSIESGIEQVKITLVSGKVTLEDGQVLKREGAFTKVWDHSTEEIAVQGEATGVNRNGVVYQTVISEPLVFKQSCLSQGIWIPTQGVRMISRSGKANISVNYGAGECDRTVEVTLQGESKTVELAVK
uniref:Lipoprotein n=1 Tax=Roseihalotalea indica TaxID=2867963 RepID=A0AA49JGK1_9BACT|nr:hypothetical protein K4G66_30365 [Tunicatimonas sp. TK19036]